jgi:hypothetical protein
MLKKLLSPAKEVIGCDIGHRPRGAGVPKAIKHAEVSPASRSPIKNWERRMTYLTGVANQRPLLRITAQVLLAFCCAAPLVLAFSSFVAYGVHTLMH